MKDMSDWPELEGVKLYPIVWVEGKLLFRDLPRRMATDLFGICGFSKRICKVAAREDWLAWFTVHNVLVHPGKSCEEKFRCLDFDCPLNRTTRVHLEIWLGKMAKKLPKDFGERTLSFNRAPDGSLHSFGEFIKEGYDGGLILVKGKGGKRRRPR